MNIFKEIIIFILQLEARLVLKKYKPNIITITGSVGKTSTKSAVYAVLSEFFFVRKSEKIFDNRIGFPLTILGSSHGSNNPFLWLKIIFEGIKLLISKQQYPGWLILETSVKRPGQIKKIISWLSSDIVIVTPFGLTPPHVEFFKSPEHLIEEKSSLIQTLKPDGLLLLNIDDPQVLELKQKTKTKVFSFGFGDDVMVKASNEQILYGDTEAGPTGIGFKINYDGNSVPIEITGALGKNHIYAGAAALAIAYAKDLNMITASRALEKYDTPPGRMKLIKGVKETVIIDDTYNSSPIACEEALKTLKEIKTSNLPAQAGQKIALLADMLELGKHTDEAHKRIGRLAAESADKIVTVGMRARFIAQGALIGGMSEKDIFQFEDAKRAGKFLEQEIKKGDIILIKGSQYMRMERAVEEIMEHPEEKERLLVRQSKEWQGN